jgi:hypothetical protein
MDRKRRNFITRIGQWMIAAPVGLIAAIGFAQMRSTALPERPLAGQDANLDDIPAPNPKEELKRSQKQIKDDVEKLYMLAEKIKEQVEKTDSTTFLSLSFVESTKKIENLTKQIRNHAVG